MRDYLYRALTTPHGIELSTDDAANLIQKLHAARREAKDHRLTNLVISRRSESIVWIINKPESEDAPDGQET